MIVSSVSLSLLENIRRDKSQKEISSSLGYSFNQYYKWESGSKKCRWSEFVAICGEQSLSLKDSLELTFCIDLDSLDSGHVITEIMEMFFQNRDSELSSHLNISELTLERYKKGTTEYDLETFLKIVDFIADRLVVFIDLLDESHRDASLQNRRELSGRIDSFWTERPELSLICMGVGLQQVIESGKSNYQRVLSSILLIPEEKLERDIELLLDIGLLEETDSVPKTTVFRTTIKKNQRLLADSVGRMCLKRNIDNIFGKTESEEASSKKGMFRMAAVSDQAFAQIKGEIHSCYHKISQIIEQDNLDPKTRMLYLNLLASISDNKIS
ncbi:MAG: hypothetical protein AB8E15_01170 [Bdellovibrionales bacterium]